MADLDYECHDERFRLDGRVSRSRSVRCQQYHEEDGPGRAAGKITDQEPEPEMLVRFWLSHQPKCPTAQGFSRNNGLAVVDIRSAGEAWVLIPCRKTQFSRS